MSIPSLEQIEADINQLSLSDQLLLMEHLVHRIRACTLRPPPPPVDQLAAMANDSDIQRKLQQIEIEFSDAEADGLDTTR